MSNQQLSRRQFLRSAALAGIGLAGMIAGCQPQEKVVKETVVVEKEKEVTKVVEEDGHSGGAGRA